MAAVKSAKDVAFARNESGLPFYDVLLVTDLPKHASLPVSTVQQTKKRILVRGLMRPLSSFVLCLCLCPPIPPSFTFNACPPNHCPAPPLPPT